MNNIIQRIIHSIIQVLMIPIIFLGSCKEDIGVISARSGEKPGVLTNLKYTELPGGAYISYDLPKVADLRYVKAIYTLENGRQLVSKASLYDNQVRIEGFAQIGEYDVKLTAVSVGEIESDPVTIKIKTGKPAYQSLAESFKTDDHLFSTFGGLNLLYENTAASNLIIRVYKKSINGWESINETYTKAVLGTIRVRGQEAISTKFGVVVRDQWGNVSDTVQRTIVPLEEYELNKASAYKQIAAVSETNPNGDYTINNNNGLGPNSADISISLFDGKQTSPTSYDTGKQFWGRSAPIPFTFTIDLGAAAQISRVKMWARNDNDGLLYQAAHVKEFEVYGSNAPIANGDWSAWTLIGTYEGIRPSGLAFGVSPTQEDKDYAKAGEDFEVNWELQGGFRYYRVKVNSTWNGIREQPLGNALTVAISELKFFGTYTK
jgi:hypothetical protein